MCGGQSKRMGTDKGLMPFENTCRAAYMAAKLEAVGLPVVISINPGQVESYGLVFEPDQLVVDALAIGGPLNGLLSVHLHYPEDDLLLLACDMMNMQSETINTLISKYRQEPEFAFYVYQNKKFVEPFCAIYTSNSLNNLMQKTDPPNLLNASLQNVINTSHAFRLSITEMNSFANFNSL